MARGARVAAATATADNLFDGVLVGDDVIIECRRGTYTNPIMYYRRGCVLKVTAKAVEVRAPGASSGSYRKSDGTPLSRETSGRLVPITAETTAKLIECERGERELIEANERRSREYAARVERVVPLVVAYLKGAHPDEVRRIVGDADLMMWAESLTRDGHIEPTPDDKKTLLRLASGVSE